MRLVRRADGTWTVQELSQNNFHSSPSPEERKQDYFKAIRAGLEELVHVLGHVPNSWTTMKAPAERFLGTELSELDNLVANDKSVQFFCWKPLPGKRFPAVLSAPQWAESGFPQLLEQLRELWRRAYD